MRIFPTIDVVVCAESDFVIPTSLLMHNMIGIYNEMPRNG